MSPPAWSASKPLPLSPSSPPPIFFRFVSFRPISRFLSLFPPFRRDICVSFQLPGRLRGGGDRLVFFSSIYTPAPAPYNIFWPIDTAVFIINSIFKRLDFLLSSFALATPSPTPRLNSFRAFFAFRFTFPVHES